MQPNLTARMPLASNKTTGIALSIAGCSVGAEMIQDWCLTVILRAALYCREQRESIQEAE